MDMLVTLSYTPGAHGAPEAHGPAIRLSFHRCRALRNL